ncbi:MAG: glycoside hydrolase family 97 catalytic domain-containing protein [Clostridia bacterium]|nr:glycoside hydrolase family 97 catalytic domain-containing protein [Clostridia bacterium]
MKKISIFLLICMIITMVPFALSADSALEVAEGWEIPVRNDENLTLNSTTSISIATAPGEMYTIGENYWLRSVTAGSDFALTLKVSGAASVNYQKAGLIIWAGNNYNENVNMLRRFHSGYKGAEIAFSTCVGTAGWNEVSVADADQSNPVWLKLEKTGTTFTGYYRRGESEEWIKVHEGVHETVANATNLKIGVLAMNGGKTVYNSALFTLEDFTLNGAVIPFAAEIPDNTYPLTSPDGTRTATFGIDASGNPYYSVMDGEETVIEKSRLGLVTDLADFTTGLTMQSVSDVTTVTDEYTLTGAKISDVTAAGNERTFTFTKDDATFKVIARMYNDGLAFRYAVEGSGILSISSEATTVKIPFAAVVQAIPYKNQNENITEAFTSAQLTGDYCEPMLYEFGENFVLLSEAAVNGNYCGTYLAGDGTGSVNYHLSKEQSGNVTASLPFTSPWRFAVIGTAGEIAMNTMAETLSPAAEGDFSWVEPGVTSWTWLNGDCVNSLETYKEYVDLSAEMGWKYLLLDEGWQPKDTTGAKVYVGYYDWFPDLLNYAEEKGVKLLVWANHNDLLDDTYRKALFAEWAEMGIAGLKPDFFNSSSQAYYQLYDKMYEETAENHLILNLHGITKPAGERRTYPQLLTREGVYGNENMLWVLWNRTDKPVLDAEYNCMLPFVRGAVGPADYTPMFSHYLRTAELDYPFSKAHLAALTVVIESGIQCLADQPEAYLNTTAVDFFKDLPASWEESKVLTADPGELAVFARRNGADWYLGGICNTAATAKVDLSFLGEGNYYAVLVKDGKTVKDCTADTLVVTNETVLDIPMLATGGFALRILSEAPDMPDTLALDRATLSVEAGKNASIHATTIMNGSIADATVLWKSSDETVVTVKNGVVTGVKGGNATVTATYSAYGTTLTKECAVTVIPTALSVAEGWEIPVRNDNNMKLNTATSITIDSQAGELYNIAENYWLRSVTAGSDFSLTVKVSGVPLSDYHKAGLIIWAGNNYNENVNMLRRYHTNGAQLALSTCVGAYGWNEPNVADQNTSAPVYLKLEKSGTTFTGYYRYSEAEEWIPVGSATHEGFANAADLKIGVLAINGKQTNTTPVTFTLEDFALNGTVIPFAAVNGYQEVDPAGVSLNAEKAELEVGKVQALTASLLPGDANDQTLIWSSSNEAVATVKNGVITAHSAGFAAVTVTSGSYSATCLVKVGDPLGNVNGDWSIDTADVVSLMRHLVGYEDAIIETAADLNADGKRTIYDAVLLLKMLSE